MTFGNECNVTYSCTLRFLGSLQKKEGSMEAYQTL
jgi:hypothetical protein